MKRQKYEVILDGKQVAVKSAFNTAAGVAIQSIVREIGKSEGQLYELRESTIERSESDYYDITGGRRVWVGAKTLRRLEFTIRKLDAT